MREDELYHYGILGMKWGVRRFQNPDGSYTQAGKERYGRSSGSRTKNSTSKTRNPIKRAKNKIERIDYEHRHRLDELSDEDLAKGIARLQKETQYLNLTNQKYRSLDELSRNERSTARKKVDKAMNDVGHVSMELIKPIIIGLGAAGVRELLIRGGFTPENIAIILKKFVGGKK